MTRVELLDYAMTVMIATQHSLNTLAEGHRMKQEIMKQVLESTNHFALAVADVLIDEDNVEKWEFVERMHRAAARLGLEIESTELNTQTPQLN